MVHAAGISWVWCQCTPCVHAGEGRGQEGWGEEVKGGQGGWREGGREGELGWGVTGGLEEEGKEHLTRTVQEICVPTPQWKGGEGGVEPCLPRFSLSFFTHAFLFSVLLSFLRFDL